MNRIIIQTSDYFTKESWEQVIESFNTNYKNKFSFIFVTTNNELLEHIGHAHACFCFSGIKKIQQFNNQLRLIYIGISDIDYADDKGSSSHCNIYTSKGIASKLIAEFSLLSALTLSRKFHIPIRNQLKRNWDQVPLLNEPIKSISEYNIGVLGLGTSGKEIVNIFTKIGCNVFGLSKFEKSFLNNEKWFSTDELGEFLRLSEILIIALPLRKETKHLLQLEHFKLLGPDSYLINISRGNIIKEDDLVIALKNNIIKGAIIDVSSIEPIPKKSKLWKLPNLVITPHIAGNANYFVPEIQNDFLNRLYTI